MTLSDSDYRQMTANKRKPRAKHNPADTAKSVKVKAANHAKRQEEAAKGRNGDNRYMTHHNSTAQKPFYNEETRSYELMTASKYGVRHNFSKRFLLDVFDDWRNHGSEVLAAVRRDEPATYLRIMASLVPKTLQIEDSNDGKSSSELRTELLVELGRALERGDAQLTQHIEELQRGSGQGPVIDVQAVQETD